MATPGLAESVKPVHDPPGQLFRHAPMPKATRSIIIPLGNIQFAFDTETLRAIALDTDGVRNVHELRSRRMGHDILLDVHLVVRPEISVSEGHQIGMKVVTGMRGALDNIRDINFHIDAENDEQSPHVTQPHLPSREEIRSILATQLGSFPAHNRLRLHYLKNRIHIEIFLDDPEQSPLTTTQVRTALVDYPWFGSVRVWQATG